MQTDVLAELKNLRLHGMAQAWAELESQGDGVGMQTSRWLVEHLLRAEHVERHMRSVAHQMKSARLPLHRDLAGFAFEGTAVDQALIKKLADLSFTDQAHNAVLIGGPGTGKTTIIRVLTDCFKRKGGKVLLAAPTGRAARRLSELTGCPAQTLHRLLALPFGGQSFLQQRLGGESWIVR